MATKEPSLQTPSARIDRDQKSLVIDHLIVQDRVVVGEAQRWADARADRSTLAEDPQLSDFVSQALIVGAGAIGMAGSAQQSFDLEALVTEVGERSTAASAETAKAMSDSLRRTVETVEAVTAATKLSLTETGDQTRRAFAVNVDAARKTLADDIHRLVGGDNPELLAKLAPLLDTFGRSLEERSVKQTSELIAKVVRQFDPADPASPMSQHARTLADQQAKLAAGVAEGQRELAAKIQEVATAVTVTRATVSALQATPLKGETYAQGVHRVMSDLAAGLGDEYLDTSAVTGMVSRNKKGDGVLALEGGDVRVVLEMSDSPRGGPWGPYLQEAERNRDALASLGLVPRSDQLNGQGLITLGSRRIVMAFDPAIDSPELLRAAIQLLRLSAQAAASRTESGELREAEDKITQALKLMTKIDVISKTAGLIKQHAGKIDDESGCLRVELSRVLTQAQSALAGVSRRETQHDAA